MPVSQPLPHRVDRMLAVVAVAVTVVLAVADVAVVNPVPSNHSPEYKQREDWPSGQSSFYVPQRWGKGVNYPKG